MAYIDLTQQERVNTKASSKIKRLGRSVSQRRMSRETEKLPLAMIDEKPTDGTSTGKKDQDGHGMMKSENFLRCSEPRRRIGDFFLSRWSWSDECWFFSRQSFSGFRTHVAATAVCKTGMVCKHSLVVRTFFCTWRVHSHIRTLLMRVTHTHGSSPSRVKKVFVARVSYFSILLSPSHVSPILAVHWRSLRRPFLTLTSARSCRAYLSWKRRACASPHEQRGVWLSGQVRPQHRIWAQEVRHNLFCGQWHDARWRSKPPWNLWLLEKHTREHWTVRCSHNVWTLRFARFSRWFCSSYRKQRKHASGNRLLDRERKERKVLWSVL